MATLEISAQTQFNHTEDLLGYQVPRNDPRQDDFDWDSVRIDLSRCTFVRPAGVLWCTIYPLLVAERRIPCELLVAYNPGVTSYLNRLGLFETLRTAGVEIDYLGMPSHHQGRLMLPLTRLTAISQVEELGEVIVENLARGNLSSSNVYDHINTAFAELANNAVEHANSPIDAYGYVQYYDFVGYPRFVCAIADGGIGIRTSLAKNPDHRRIVQNDGQAIEYALEENISVHGNTRGLGLSQIAEFVLPSDRELNINSGNGFLHTTGGMPTPGSSRLANLFPGTSAFINIPA